MDRKAKAWMVLVLFVSGVVVGPGTEGARDDHHMGMKADDHDQAKGGGYYYNPQALWRWGAAASWLGWLPLGIWAVCCSGRGDEGMLGHKGHFGKFGAATDNTHEMATTAAAAATDNTHEMATTAAAAATDNTHEMATTTANQAP